jgi:glutaredoxin 3
MYTVLSSPNCKWCLKAEALLGDEGLPYVTYDISKPENKLRREMLVREGLRTVPQVYSPDDDLIGGYEDLVNYLNP